MKMVKSKLALSAAVAALALSATAANAAVTFTSTAFEIDPSVASGQTTVMTFDNPAAAGYTIIPGATVTAGTTANEYAAPAGDATTYYYVQGGGQAIFSSIKALTELSLYIGSLDNYNSIEFWSGGVGGTSVGTWSGLDYAPANGDQGAGVTNRRFYFDFGGSTVDTVVFKSTSNSFEFDNIAVSAVPEPGVWALMIAGFGMMGAALRRRRSVAGVLA